MNTSVAGGGTTSHVVMIDILAHYRVRSVAVMHKRRCTVLVGAEHTRERSAQDQEREKTDDNAVPFHDPEHRSQHRFLNPSRLQNAPTAVFDQSPPVNRNKNRRRVARLRSGLSSARTLNDAINAEISEDRAIRAVVAVAGIDRTAHGRPLAAHVVQAIFAISVLSPGGGGRNKPVA